MADEDLGTGSVEITLDATAADAGLSRLQDRIERALYQAAVDGTRRMERQINSTIRRINPIRLEITADTARFQAAVNRLNNIGSTPLEVTPDIDRERFVRQAQALLRGATVSVRVVPDMTGFNAAVARHRVPPIDVRVNADVDSNRLTRALTGLGKIAGKSGKILATGLKFSAITIAAASAAQSVIGLTAALAPAVGILAAAPAAALAYASVLGTLKLATAGVGDAFGAALSGDAKKFNEALQTLSPAAQKAAREVRGLKPAFDGLRKSVQNALFAPLAGQITATAKALQGPLRAGLTGISAQFGAAAKQVLLFAQSKDAISGIGTTLATTRTALAGVTSGIQPLLKGILDIGSAVSTAFAGKAGAAIGNAATQFGTFLSTAAASGNAVSWVSNAVTVFKQLGTILGNVGGIISSVFASANAVGGGLLNNLGKITGEFEKFVKSAEGQNAIQSIFTTLSTVAVQFGPILAALVSQVGQIAPLLAPLFNVIGPAIVGVIEALGPALQTLGPGLDALVGGLADALQQIGDSGALDALGSAISDVASALAPLLPLIGDLVGALGDALGPAVSAIAKALSPVITALSDALTPILPPLTDAFLSLVTALTPLLDLVGSTLAGVIRAAAPLLLTLANAVVQLVDGLAPLITQLTEQLVPVFDMLAPLITQLVTALSPLIGQLVKALLPALPPLIDVLIALLNAVLPLLPAFVDLVVAVAPLVSLILAALGPTLEFAANIVKWLSIQVVVPVIQGVVSTLLTIVSAVVTVVRGVTSFVLTMTGLFKTLGSNIASAVSSAVSAVVGFFQRLPGQARDAVSSIGSFLGGVFTAAGARVRDGASAIVTDAVNIIKRLPGQARAGLGNLGSLLFSAGQDLIRGMINGVKSMAGALVDSAKNVVSGAVSGAKHLLGIHSPSTVFREIGVFTGQGLINGLVATTRKVAQAAVAMASKVTGAFGSSPTVATPTIGTVAALSAITRPFGSSPTLGTNPSTRGRQSPPQAPSQASGGGTAVAGMVNNFTINEVGDADATAERVVNRLVLAANVGF